MYLLIGLAIVAASVFTGYTLAHGEWGVLFQPAEFIIILGCGLGAFFGSQTKYTFSLIVKSLKHLFADPGSSKSRYLETLALLYALFSKMHREGVISIESDVEKPEASPIFSKYPNVSKDTRIDRRGIRPPDHSLSVPAHVRGNGRKAQKRLAPSPAALPAVGGSRVHSRARPGFCFLS